jgi:UDP-N-acetylmuramoyl-tripeptide--D-alanyl-D-alanine ligase
LLSLRAAPNTPPLQKPYNLKFFFSPKKKKHKQFVESQNEPEKPKNAIIKPMTIVSKLKKRFYFVFASYFKFFANISLKKWRPRIIAITGSVGKTTMLGLVESQLGPKAHFSHNANSAYGIAFDILGLKGVTGSKLYWLYLFIAAPARAFFYQHRKPFYVVEIDGERPRETEFVARWLRPEVTIWVSLGLSHAVFYEEEVKKGHFSHVEDAIAHEFSMLPRYTSALTLVDADNNLMHNTTRGVSSIVKKLSRDSITNYTVTPNSSKFTIGKYTFKFAYPMPKEVGIQLVMLTELMKYLKIPVNPNLSDFVMPPGRNNPLKGKNGLKIIDSSYNAHLVSMSSILDMASELKVKHKWLVIGDMIEQGTLEAAEHEKLAELIKSVKPEQVVLVGRRTAKHTYPRLKKHLSVVSFDKPQEALEYLEKNLTGKETIIFKGSQYLEWIIEKLLNDPADISLLVRQDVAHKKRRESWGLK